MPHMPSAAARSAPQVRIETIGLLSVRPGFVRHAEIIVDPAAVQIGLGRFVGAAHGAAQVGDRSVQIAQARFGQPAQAKIFRSGLSVSHQGLGVFQRLAVLAKFEIGRRASATRIEIAGVQANRSIGVGNGFADASQGEPRSARC